MSPHPKYAVEFARIAEQDLISILDCISADDPITAKRVLNQFEERVATLERFPERGRVVPELSAIGLKTHREMIISPWRLIYRISEKTVYIVALFDGRRNMEDILMERIVRQ
jgi:toxin ParE1/3/4